MENKGLRKSASEDISKLIENMNPKYEQLYYFYEDEDADVQFSFAKGDILPVTQLALVSWRKILPGVNPRKIYVLSLFGALNLHCVTGRKNFFHLEMDKLFCSNYLHEIGGY